MQVKVNGTFFVPDKMKSIADLLAMNGIDAKKLEETRLSSIIEESRPERVESATAFLTKLYTKFCEFEEVEPIELFILGVVTVFMLTEGSTVISIN